MTQRINREQLHSDERSRAILYRNIENRPVMLHWWHYMDEQYIANLGGLEHVLQTPVYSVKPLLTGAAFQITKDYFDPANPEHLAAQKTAMQYLGIWDYEPWVPPKRPISRPRKRPPGWKEKMKAIMKKRKEKRKGKE